MTFAVTTEFDQLIHTCAWFDQHLSKMLDFDLNILDETSPVESF